MNKCQFLLRLVGYFTIILSHVPEIVYHIFLEPYCLYFGLFVLPAEHIPRKVGVEHWGARFPEQ